MEEDESKGWEIQEYYSPSSDADENNKVTLRRIIRRGLRIGKTLVVTGVVISSAPFILPPLMVVSAVGLACSVPFGVFVASYAGAEKLMSILLPMPRPPPPLPLMLEYKGSEATYDFDLQSDVDDIHENEVDDVDELEEDPSLVSREAEAESDAKSPLEISKNVDIQGDVDMEEEEEWLLKDTKADIEMRISLPVGEGTETVSEDKYYEGMTHDAELKVEEGYQEDEESSAQQDEQSTAISGTGLSGIEIHPMVEILRQERPNDNVNIDDSNIAQKTHEDIVCTVVEVEGPYGLTIGAVEQTTPEKEGGDAHQAEQSVPVSLEGSCKHKEPTSNTREDGGSQFTAKHRAIKINDVRSTGVEGRMEMSNVIETAIFTPAEETMKTSEHELVSKKDNRSKEGINIDPLNVELVGKTPLVQRENSKEKHVAAYATSTTKRKKKAKKKKAESEETTTEGNELKIHSVEHPSSTVDAKNIADEGCLNLVSDKEAEGETQPNKTVTESGTASRTPSGRSLKASPKKALISEQKIWENIEALRTIVGYRVARQQSCMEELKALYIFTGVEPPMSFKSSPDVQDSPDLDDVNYKLQFLMAIVGVK